MTTGTPIHSVWQVVVVPANGNGSSAMSASLNAARNSSNGSLPASARRAAEMPCAAKHAVAKRVVLAASSACGLPIPRDPRRQHGAAHGRDHDAGDRRVRAGAGKRRRDHFFTPRGRVAQELLNVAESKVRVGPIRRQNSGALQMRQRSPRLPTSCPKHAEQAVARGVARKALHHLFADCARTIVIAGRSRLERVVYPPVRQHVRTWLAAPRTPHQAGDQLARCHRDPGLNASAWPQPLIARIIAAIM